MPLNFAHATENRALLFGGGKRFTAGDQTDRNYAIVLVQRFALDKDIKPRPFTDSGGDSGTKEDSYVNAGVISRIGSTSHNSGHNLFLFVAGAGDFGSPSDEYNFYIDFVRQDSGGGDSPVSELGLDASVDGPNGLVTSKLEAGHTYTVVALLQTRASDANGGSVEVWLLDEGTEESPAASPSWTKEIDASGLSISAFQDSWDGIALGYSWGEFIANRYSGCTIFDRVEGAVFPDRPSPMPSLTGSQLDRIAAGDSLGDVFLGDGSINDSIRVVCNDDYPLVLARTPHPSVAIAGEYQHPNSGIPDVFNERRIETPKGPGVVVSDGVVPLTHSIPDAAQDFTGSVLWDANSQSNGLEVSGGASVPPKPLSLPVSDRVALMSVSPSWGGAGTPTSGFLIDSGTSYDESETIYGVTLNGSEGQGLYFEVFDTGSERIMPKRTLYLKPDELSGLSDTDEVGTNFGQADVYYNYFENLIGQKQAMLDFSDFPEITVGLDGDNDIDLRSSIRACRICFGLIVVAGYFDYDAGSGSERRSFVAWADYDDILANGNSLNGDTPFDGVFKVFDIEPSGNGFPEDNMGASWSLILSPMRMGEKNEVYMVYSDYRSTGTSREDAGYILYLAKFAHSGGSGWSLIGNEKTPDIRGSVDYPGDLGNADLPDHVHSAMLYPGRLNDGTDRLHLVAVEGDSKDNGLRLWISDQSDIDGNGTWTKVGRIEGAGALHSNQGMSAILVGDREWVLPGDEEDLFTVTLRFPEVFPETLTPGESYVEYTSVYANGLGGRLNWNVFDSVIPRPGTLGFGGTGREDENDSFMDDFSTAWINKKGTPAFIRPASQSIAFDADFAWMDYRDPTRSSSVIYRSAVPKIITSGFLRAGGGNTATQPGLDDITLKTIGNNSYSQMGAVQGSSVKSGSSLGGNYDPAIPATAPDAGMAVVYGEFSGVLDGNDEFGTRDLFAENAQIKVYDGPENSERIFVDSWIYDPGGMPNKAIVTEAPNRPRNTINAAYPSASKRWLPNLFTMAPDGDGAYLFEYSLVTPGADEGQHDLFNGKGLYYAVESVRIGPELVGDPVSVSGMGSIDDHWAVASWAKFPENRYVPYLMTPTDGSAGDGDDFVLMEVDDGSSAVQLCMRVERQIPGSPDPDVIITKFVLKIGATEDVVSLGGRNITGGYPIVMMIRRDGTDYHATISCAGKILEPSLTGTGTNISMDDDHWKVHNLDIAALSLNPDTSGFSSDPLTDGDFNAMFSSILEEPALSGGPQGTRWGRISGVPISSRPVL